MRMPVRRLLFVLAALAALLAPAVLAGTALASWSQPHNVRAPAGIGPEPIIVLRLHRIDLVRNRVVQRFIPIFSGPVSIGGLIRAIGDERWASLSDGVATLRAALMQRPGTTLLVESPVTTVLLVDSVGQPVYLTGTGASVTFTGVTVRSATGTGTGIALESNHRPYLWYPHMSITIAKSTFRGLGTRSAPIHSGFGVGAGSTLTATDTTFADGGRGLYADTPARLALTRVTATGNGGAGITLVRAPDASLTGVSTDHNTIGLVLRGPLGTLRMANVAASANGVGVELSALGTRPVGPVATSHNTTAGVDVTGCPGCTLAGVASMADQVGVRFAASAAGATVRDGTVGGVDTGIEVAAANAHVTGVAVTVAGGGTGVHVLRAAPGAQISGGTVTGGAFGVSLDGPHATLTGTHVLSANVGVRVSGGATGSALTQVSTDQTGTGVVIARGVEAVSLRAVTVHQGGGIGIRSGGAGTTIANSTVDGAAVGIVVTGHTVVTGGGVTGAAEAVRLGRGARAELTGTSLQAHVLALRIAPTGHITLVGCRVSAPLGARGDVSLKAGTAFPALPLRWLGVFALAVLAVALVLEMLRRVRERGHERRVLAPAHVTNIS
jgi:hypothetical protein